MITVVITTMVAVIVHVTLVIDLQQMVLHAKVCQCFANNGLKE